MAARARILALALLLSSTAALVHCTSFGTSGDEPTEADASTTRPSTDAQVAGDRAVPPPAPLDGGDASVSDTGPVGATDYTGVATTTELPLTPPYAFLPPVGTTGARYFALAMAPVDGAREITVPGLPWPVSRTQTFAMVRVNSIDNGAMGGLVTSGLATDGQMEIGKRNTEGEGSDTRNGTMVTAVRSDLYFAREAPGSSGDVFLKVIEPNTLRITSSTKVLAGVPRILRPFAVSEDELVLARQEQNASNTITLHARATTSDTFPTAGVTKTITPPIGPGDGLLGFHGKQIYAYRAIASGKIVVFAYSPR